MRKRHLKLIVRFIQTMCMVLLVACNRFCCIRYAAVLCDMRKSLELFIMTSSRNHAHSNQANILMRFVYQSIICLMDSLIELLRFENVKTIKKTGEKMYFILDFVLQGIAPSSLTKMHTAFKHISRSRSSIAVEIILGTYPIVFCVFVCIWI